jgi:formylglycine-generating enzyme required for sulfatase activity
MSVARFFLAFAPAFLMNSSRYALAFAPAFLMACASVPAGSEADSPKPAMGTVDRIRIPGSPVEFTLVYVEGGRTLIGTPAGAADREEDEPEPTDVELSPFWIGQFEVTFDEYAVFRFRSRDSDSTRTETGFNVDAVSRPSPPYEDPSAGLSRPGFPATGMSQWGALQYTRWLWEKTGDFYRLPTEAEWEHACRLGGDRALDEHAWYLENSGEVLHGVGTKAGDVLGLYDMLGNASEWTLDQYRPDYGVFLGEQPSDPWVRPTSLHPRTVRGGAFDDGPEVLRCGDRLESNLSWKRRDPQIPKSFWWNTDSAFLGFRLLRPANQPTREEAAEFFSMVLGD